VARQQLGDPYVWGATGPDSWDCSGLTSRLWREVGGVKDIPRVAADQQAWAVPIPAEQALIGDLVFFGDPVTHVALYAGNGTIVDASSSQHGVVERKIWTSGVIRYGRVPRPGMPPVTPWTPPAPSPSTAPTAGGTTSAATAGNPAPSPSGKPSPSPSAKPSAVPAIKPTATPSAPAASVPAAIIAEPLRGLPAPDLAALTSVGAQAVVDARSVLGSSAWTDVELIRAAWRHAGGGVLPTSRSALVSGGVAIPTRVAHVGDLVVYGATATHLGMYLGHGYMVDASVPGHVAVRRVYASSSVRFVRLRVVPAAP
jgi:cell wall-associated NlpC family hydrolase